MVVGLGDASYDVVAVPPQTVLESSAARVHHDARLLLLLPPLGLVRHIVGHEGTGQYGESAGAGAGAGMAVHPCEDR